MSRLSICSICGDPIRGEDGNWFHTYKSIYRHKPIPKEQPPERDSWPILITTRNGTEAIHTVVAHFSTKEHAVEAIDIIQKHDQKIRSKTILQVAIALFTD